MAEHQACTGKPFSSDGGEQQPTQSVSFNSDNHRLFTGGVYKAMDTFYGPCFHFYLEVALETWVKSLLTHSLWVHDLGHTHSLVSVQQSGPSKQKALLWTKNCLNYQNCQKWSPYKAKGAFSTPFCARKQTSGPPIIDQGFSTGSCNRHHALSGRAVDPPTSPCPTLSAGVEPIFKMDCTNW